MKLTAAQQKYFAYWLTRSLPSDSLGKLTASLQDAQVDLTPHQIDAALFAFKSPLSKGAILADEVGLGKTIEAGIILSQFWAEHRRHLLIIAPANLRKQWAAELQEKFFLPSRILEAKTFNRYIEDGNLNPFNCQEIVICSYQFAKTKAPYLKQTNWDLVVIDEAHRLRNVYKPTNKISNTIKNALADRKKILLTATPLQNSILELYGLTTIIDDYAFGDLKSFKMQYNRNLDETDYANLRRRLAPLCKRTLRRQVLEYVRYTKRIAILQEFFPTKQEQELYDLVSEYLQRPRLYALPNSQRQLMTLILRKLLASSTHAIYGTLCALIEKLEAKLKRQGVEQSDDELFKYDYEDYESETEEWLDYEEDEDEPDEEEMLSPEDIEPGNMFIHGDNLVALRALENDFIGQVKCIYIDPPYNTGSAFEHYDDNIEHSIWLSLLRERLVILHRLLSKDGSIWISLDYEEQAYCKVLCDEVFGRRNFVANVIWEKKFSPSNDAKWLSDSHDFVIVYAKNKDIWRQNLLPKSCEMDSRYRNLDNDPRGVWTSGDCSVKTYSASCDYPIITPSGRIVNPPAGYCWRYSKEKFEKLVADNRIWFGSEGNNVPRIKRFLSDVKAGVTALTIWKHTEVGNNQEAKKEVKIFNSDSVFSTPKPERLIERILILGSNPGDIVLDSFLGSGTTAAVAHKMGRRWIGVELGDHAYTHCAVRMKKVIEGEQGGISKSVNWQGGGGFKFYELAPSLLNKDKYGNLVINKEYNADMLAAAMAKHQGFTYSPDEEIYWKQGKSSEHDYIFTTTQLITAEMLETIHEQLGEDNSLLICCTKFQPECRNKFPNITIKKIPKVLLDTCEFDRDDYSLNIISVPEIEDEEWEEPDTETDTETEGNSIKQPSLFD